MKLQKLQALQAQLAELQDLAAQAESRPDFRAQLAPDAPNRAAAIERFKREAEPVDLGQRLETKTKLTPHGEFTNLEAAFGKGNVIQIEDGNYAILQPGKPPKVLEKDFMSRDGFWESLKEVGADIVDVLPEAGEAILGAAGSALIKPIASVATSPLAMIPAVGPALAMGASHLLSDFAGDTVANVGRQYVSHQLPGEDFPESNQQEGIENTQTVAEAGVLPSLGSGDKGEFDPNLGQAAIAGLAGAGGGAVARGLGAVLKGPANYARRLLSRDVTQEALEQGHRAAAEGIETSAGQLGGRGAQLAEAEARKVAPGAFQLRDARQAVQMSEYARRTLDTIGPQTAPETVGKKVGAAYSAELTQRLAAVEKAATENFGKARAMLGDQKVALMTNTTQVIDDILTTNKGAGTGVLRALRKELEQGASIGRLDKLLQQYGKAASKGNFQILERLDKGSNQQVAKRIFGALNDDLGELSVRAGEEGQAGAAIKGARDAYRQGMESIDAFRVQMLDDALEKMLPKKARGQITIEELQNGKLLAKKLATDIDAATTGKVLKTIDAIAPDEGAALRRNLVEGILDKYAAVGPGVESRLAREMSSNATVYDPGNLAKAFSKEQEKLVTVLGKNSAQYKAVEEMARLGEAFKAARQVATDKGNDWLKEVPAEGTLKGLLGFMNTKKAVAKVVTDPKLANQWLSFAPTINRSWGERVIAAAKTQRPTAKQVLMAPIASGGDISGRVTRFLQALSDFGEPQAPDPRESEAAARPGGIGGRR